MDREEEQRRIAEVSWYHDFDFGGGLRAETCHENPDGIRAVWGFIEEQLGRLPFAGATVLDIGAWDGYWSFLAERRGARKVLATDDQSQRWARDGGILLARDLLGSSVEVREDVPVYELASLDRTFDIVLCLGVFYHLWDPLAAFAQIRHCCHPNTIVVIEGEAARAGMHDFEVRYRQSSWQECMMSASALDHLLRLSYLQPRERVWMLPPDADAAPQKPQLDRCVTFCDPFYGQNAVYAYRPHFGLHGYDDRFDRPATDADGLSARLVVTACPRRVAAGAVFQAKVSVHNTGSRTWRALAAPRATRWLAPEPSGPASDPAALFVDGGTSVDAYAEAVSAYRRFIEQHWLEGAVTLGAHLEGPEPDSARHDYARGLLSHDTKPGEWVHVDVPMRAPALPGEYSVTFDPVSEFVRWFGTDRAASTVRFVAV